MVLPVTVLETRDIFGDVDETLRRFDARDDVFVPEFGFVLIEKPAAANATVARAAGAWPRCLPARTSSTGPICTRPGGCTTTRRAPSPSASSPTT